MWSYFNNYLRTLYKYCIVPQAHQTIIHHPQLCILAGDLSSSKLVVIADNMICFDYKLADWHWKYVLFGDCDNFNSLTPCWKQGVDGPLSHSVGWYHFLTVISCYSE